MKTIIVLAMHGSPANDFPRPDLAEWFGLHQRVERAESAERPALEQRLAQLEARMRSWPRTPENDPFHAHSLELALQLEHVTGLPVIVGFNEFCAPSLEEALQQAAAKGAEKVVTVTPMMTRGGEHVERDIPAAIQRVQDQHPDLQLVYAWPFRSQDVAAFLATRIGQLP
jgi:sirohydrochlorin cobaltochelatase